MLAATAKSLLDVYKDSPEVLGGGHLTLLILGSVIAFVVALLSIRFLIGWLQQHGFRAFGWYRIAMGLFLFGLIALGILHA
jgi:undecaprenyl-diphosphatase